MRKLVFFLWFSLCYQAAEAQYCQPGTDVGTALGSYIDSVGMLGLSNLSGPSTAPFYELFSNVPVLNLEAGGNYNLTVVAGSMPNDYFTVWVDWNNDLDFDDDGENMGEQSNALPGQTLVFPFQVPAAASTSFKRMRIRCGPNVNLEPCLNYTYGETEDYRLLIVPAPSSYCAPSSIGGSANGMYIEAVRLNEFVHSTGASGSPYYVFADSLLVPNLTAGSTQKLMLRGGTNTFMRLAAWVDWNRDGDFNDAGESIGQENHNQALQTHEFYFTVPDTLVAGMYRMRVRCAGTGSTLNPCANYVDGETEDYRVAVLDSVHAACIPGFAAGSVNFVNRVTLNEMLFDLAPNSGPGFYANYTSDYRKASLKAQKSYIVALGAEGPNFASTRYGIWLDYNRDGDFNDAQEFLGETQVGSAFGQASILFNTPANFNPGLTRMRILTAPTGAASLNPCGNYGTGACHDFGVELLQYSAGLCVPEGGTTDQGDFIEAFSMGDIAVEEGAFGTAGYHYYGDRVHRTTPGATVSMQLRSGGDGSQTQYAAVWVDWNNNLIFDASEQMGLDTLTGVTGPTVSWNLTVPGNQAAGFVHVRVRLVRNALNNTPVLSACSQHSFGETEDYRLYVQASLPSYCSNLHSNAGYSGVSINKVGISDTEFSKNANGCEALSGNGYTVWPISTATAAVLLPLQAYYVKVDAEPSARVGVWMDANQNGQFESSEFYPVFATVGNTRLFLITTPLATTSGYTRLRIRTRSTGAAIAATEACTLFNDGETEDFMVFMETARGAAPVAAFEVLQNGEEASYESSAANFSDSFNWNFMGSVGSGSPGTNPTAYYFGAAPGCYATALSVTNAYGSDMLVNPCAVYLPETQQCSKLLISEYLCDAPHNKAIELVNASSAPIDLSAYALALYVNGSLQASQQLSLSGNVQPYQTFVVANPAAAANVQAAANVLSGVCSFTGNDAVALLYNGTIVDMVGALGENPQPGWPIGAEYTHAVDLQRDITVGAPNALWNAALSEWITNAPDMTNQLGSHDFNCGTFQSQSPQAAFSVSQNVVCAGDCITLTDETTGTPSTWIWSVPGAVNENVNGANPGPICYNTPGTYAISLTVTNALGFDTETQNAAITVLPYPTPSLSLNGSTLVCNGCVGNVVWYWNGEVVEGESANQLEAFAAGNYSLSSTNAAGCTALSNTVAVFTVGTALAHAAGASVYPNPSHDRLMITLPNESQNARYCLRDATGRILFEGRLDGVTQTLEWNENMARGMYLLSVWYDGMPQHFRILKN